MQALANNLLGRAVQLSRHEAVGADASVCCTLAVAELQMQQARGMMGKGMASLAVALLSSSLQQLTSTDMQGAAGGSPAHADGLQAAKKQVGAVTSGATKVPAHLTLPAASPPPT